MLMCGIVGVCNFKGIITAAVLKDMRNKLRHRGPDDDGFECWEEPGYSLGLAQQRLSIIDLSPLGHQPMSSQDNQLAIVFNGEIYNYSELKNDLQTIGYEFSTNSDTEVILQSFKCWGHGAVERFIGMFAFAIYDKTQQKVFIYRDRAGVKPLFYYHHNDLFLFASELKAFYQHPDFEKHINKDSLALYLQYGYIPAPHSILKHVYKLMPGHYLSLDLQTQKLSIHKYWDVYNFYNKPKLNICEQDALQETEHLLKSACKYRMVADVPVGIFLSGGYDSSAVAALLQTNYTERIKTFTIGFHEKGFDEAPYAKDVAEHLGTDHIEYYCTQKDAAEIIPLLPSIYDEPFGDSSAIPTVLVSRLAKRHVKVSLSADGGDEVFGGYNKYALSIKYFSIFNKLPSTARNGISACMDFFNSQSIPYFNNRYNFESRYEKIKGLLKANNPISAMKYTSQYFSGRELERLLIGNFDLARTSFDDSDLLYKNNDSLNCLMAVDYKTYMPDDILTKVDRATMSVSLEGREPLLDHRLIEFLAQLPSSFKIRNDTKKYLLKQIVHKYLPKKMMDRPKMGFGVPIVAWFRDELKEYLLYYLSKERLDAEGFFNSAEVIRMRDSYLTGKKININKLWIILMFQMWFEKWITTSQIKSINEPITLMNN